MFFHLNFFLNYAGVGRLFSARLTFIELFFFSVSLVDITLLIKGFAKLFANRKTSSLLISLSVTHDFEPAVFDLLLLFKGLFLLFEHRIPLTNR